MRPRLGKSKEGGAYFAAPAKGVDFIPSGCKLLDCVLSGGWPLGRVSNVVGDKSTGKTLLAIEACANFAASTLGKGRIWYNEAEAAFDKDYAKALGLPLDRVDLIEDCNTVEDFFEHLDGVLEKKKDASPGLYILDSLDALSDRAELGRNIDEGSYGAAKAKKMSELFRRLVRKLREKNVHVMIISQVRDAIGVKFGEKHTRTGGRALDFYASQVLFLAQTGKISRTMSKQERVIGVKIRARCKKNKVGLPHRQCDFSILFGYGVDDEQAMLDWLEEVGVKTHDSLDDAAPLEVRSILEKLVEENWYRIEQGFLPTKRKYG